MCAIHTQIVPTTLEVSDALVTPVGEDQGSIPSVLISTSAVKEHTSNVSYYLMLFAKWMVRSTVIFNKPFPSSCQPHLQSESNWAGFVMVIRSSLLMDEN